MIRLLRERDEAQCLELPAYLLGSRWLKLRARKTRAGSTEITVATQSTAGAVGDTFGSIVTV